MSDSAAKAVTYFTKKLIECPICQGEFRREELRTGRGRLIAGKLTQELRRYYEPTEKYGEIYPLMYPITVCPHCLYAVMDMDFDGPPPEKIADIEAQREERMNQVNIIDNDINFHEPRRLEEGLASHLLAILCYEFFPDEAAPAIKQALSSLRAAWLCEDLHRKRPGENFDYLRKIMYRKAQFLYKHAVELEQSGRQSIGTLNYLGPDLDKNYGYDGVLYIMGLLLFRYGPRKDPQQRLQDLDYAKRTVAKIFGMGKASKNKPAAILDNARDIYDEIRKEMSALEVETGQTKKKSKA